MTLLLSYRVFTVCFHFGIYETGKILTQANCLSVFDHFVGLALKGLMHQ